MKGYAVIYSEKKRKTDYFFTYGGYLIYRYNHNNEKVYYTGYSWSKFRCMALGCFKSDLNYIIRDLESRKYKIKPIDFITKEEFSI